MRKLLLAIATVTIVCMVSFGSHRARCVESAKVVRSEQGHDPSFLVVALTLTKRAITLSR